MNNEGRVSMDRTSMVDEERVQWNPTPEQMNEYLSREEELACHNLQEMLRANRGPMSFRDLKDSCLHTVDTLEIALRIELGAGRVVETKGYYSLV